MKNLRQLICNEQEGTCTLRYVRAWQPREVTDTLKNSFDLTPLAENRLILGQTTTDLSP